MSRYCLDTSAYSHLKRGDAAIVGLLDSAEWIGVPSIVIGELWVGFLGGDNAQRNEVELAEFMANPAVEEIVVDSRIGRIYGEIVGTLRRAGTPVPTNDIWIAAAAAAEGASVLTYDDHFALVQRVGSILLSPG